MTTKEAEKVLYQKIPLDAGRVQGWKSIPIREIGSDPLVPLGPFAEAASLTTSSIYFGEHSNSPYAKKINKLENSLLTLFARRSAARRLLAAEQLLPAGHHLLVFDAYRPYQVQQSLYNFYTQKLREKYQAMSDEMLDSEAQKYVSLTSMDPTRPAPHNTGGAVDVTIVKLDAAPDEELQQIRSRLNDSNADTEKRVNLELQVSAIMRRHGKMLDFGTAFDHGGEKSALGFYESHIATGARLTDDEMTACNNRRLLFGAMTQAGFQPYFAEWWHFNAPESQMGAAAAGLNYATFGPASLDENNRMHEAARRKAHQGVLRLHNNWPTEIIAPPKE